MLTELYAALAALFGQAGATVYLVDCVPPQAAYPYVTLSADVPAAPDGMGTVTLTCWDACTSANANRLAALDALLALIPAGGLRIRLNSGTAALFRTAEGASCVHAGPALGATLRLALRCYPAN